MRQSLGWVTFLSAILSLVGQVHCQTPYVSGWRSVPTGAPNQGNYNSFSNSGGAMTPTEVRPPASEFRDSTQQLTRAYQPPGAQQQGYQQQLSYQQPGYQQQPGYHQLAGPLAGQAPEAGQAPNAGQAQYRSISQNAPPIPTQPQMYNGNRYSLPVVANDPRFISPPPRPQGNFATSPYQGSPYRLTAYQVPQIQPPQTQPPQVQPPQVQPPYAQATQAIVPNSPAYAPQYQQPPLYAAGYQNCSPVPSVAPGALAPPTLPPNFAPQLYSPDNSGYKPLFSLGQENYNVLLGRGLIGQPTVYVPGQPVRNFLRYLSP